MAKSSRTMGQTKTRTPAKTQQNTSSPATPAKTGGSSSRLSYEEAEANLNNGGLTGGALESAKTALKSSYATPAPAPASTTPETAPEPAPAPIPSPSDYVPRYFKGASAIREPQSPERIERDLMKGAQKEINSLRDYERTLLDEQATINDKADRSTQARSVLSGLAGSSEADFAQAATSREGQKANEQIRASVQVQIQKTLSEVRKSAIEEARAQRGDYTQSLEDEAKRMELTSANIANLASSGVTFEGLRKTSPKEFEYLARQFGSTEALKGAFVLNTPQEQILDKRIEGGKYVIAKQNPITGKVTVETVDLGLPTEYTKTVDAGDRILAIPDGWDGDPSKLITINKGLTPSQAQSASTGTTTGTPQDASSQIDFLLDAANKAKELSDQSGQGSITRTFGDFVGGSKYRQLEAYTNTLRSNMLTLATDPNIKKFFGPQMSNADVLLMTSAGTTLNPQSLSPTQMQDEIERISDLLTRMKSAVTNGTPSSSGGMLVSPDGTQQVDTSSLTPEELAEARAAGWR